MAATNQTQKTLPTEPTADYDPRDAVTRAVDDCVLDLVGPLYLDEKIVVADYARTQLDRLASEVA